MDGEDADARVPLLARSVSEDRMDPPPDALYEALEYPFIDENLLQELRSIHEHDVEAGQGAGGAPEELPHGDDEVFKVRACVPVAVVLSGAGFGSCCCCCCCFIMWCCGGVGFACASCECEHGHMQSPCRLPGELAPAALPPTQTQTQTTPPDA